MAAVDASADPGALIDGLLADVAWQVRGDGTGDEDRSAPTADVAVQADSFAFQKPPASETERMEGYGRSPDEPTPQDQSEDLGDHPDQSVDEASPIDDDWPYLTDPRNSFNNLRLQSTSAALPPDGHDDITSPQSLRNRLLQPTQTIPPADVVVSDTEEVSGNVDDLGGFGASHGSAGSHIVSQPAA